MFLTSTMTVREYMEEKLCVRGLNAGEFERALEYAVRSLNEIGFSANATMSRKQGEGVLVKDCWSTHANDYTQEALDGLWKLIEGDAFTWCINMLHSKL